MKDHPIRILHVVGALGCGGVEIWLVQVLRHLDHQRFRMDFLVHTTAPSTYDDAVRALAGRILPCLHPSRPWAYARRFREHLRASVPYDVVHSHVHHYSGCVLRLARQAGVPARLAHSHATAPTGQRGLLRRGYLSLMRHWLSRHATAWISASRLARQALFGAASHTDPR